MLKLIETIKRYSTLHKKANSDLELLNLAGNQIPAPGKKKKPKPGGGCSSCSSCTSCTSCTSDD